MATATQVQNIRGNEAREMQRQIAASSFGKAEVPEVANGIPVSNDEALAESIEQWKATDIAYQRAAHEEQREQLEGAYRATQQRLAAAKQSVKDRAELEAAQDTTRNGQEAVRLSSELAALQRNISATENEWTLSLDKLRGVSNTTQKIANLTGVDLDSPQQQQPQQTRPEAFPDGSLYQLRNLPDGNLEVQLITGERFTGDPISVTQRMAEAQVNTKLWARRKVEQAQQPAEPMQVNQQPSTQPIAQSTQQSTIADYWAAEQATALAKQFGFSSKDEMLQWGENVNQKMAAVTQYEDDRLALEFTSRCPDFPGTPEAADSLVDIVRTNGWDYNADSLQAAHLLAVQNHVYQPISAEALRVANGSAPQSSRPTAPPMLRGNNPETTSGAPDPYNMPMADLRKQAIAQELNRGGPNYR